MRKFLALVAIVLAGLAAGAESAQAAGGVTVNVYHCSTWGGCNIVPITSGAAYQNGPYGGYQFIASTGYTWTFSFYAPFNTNGYARVCTANGCGNAYFGPTGGNLNIRI